MEKSNAQRSPLNAKNKMIENKISTIGKGIGFVDNPDSNDKADTVVVETEHLNTALPGDLVRVKTIDETDRDGRSLGEVISILSRAREQFVGTIVKENNQIFIQPDNFKIYTKFLLTDNLDKVLENQKVLIKFTGWEKGKEFPEAILVKIFGNKGEHETEIQAIIYEKGFVSGFDEQIEKEAKKIKDENTPFPKEEIEKRKDLRDKTIMTIDPFDAKDFDDALHIEKLENGNFEVGIHIADVSHYVTPETKLDEEAFNRAFSVYLVDRTIPMLPEILSNDLCSLNPNEEKFAFSTIFEMTPDAQVVSEWYGKSIIESKKRFTYEEAQAILDGGSGPHFDELNDLNNLAKKLKKQNKAAGSIEFEKDEIKFELDKDGRPIRIVKKERLDTHKLVEEMMLLSNRQVAKYIHKKGKELGGNQNDLMYRIHDEPNKDRVTDLAALLKVLGYHLPTTEDGSVTATNLNNLFEQIENKPEESLIKTVAIRTMSKAIYSTENLGHFGLSFEYYTHFTSPIRRYPDLLVHRILLKYINGEKLNSGDLSRFEASATLSTEREISAAEAERESIKYKQAEYMQDHIGESFDGVISGVSPWGIFVQLTETLSEGLVHISKLGDDFFNFDEKNFKIVGEKSGKEFTLGDTVTVKIESIDLDQKKIDMSLG